MINVSIITAVFNVQFCKQLSKQQQKLLLLVCLKHCIEFRGKVGAGQTARNRHDAVGADSVGGLSWRDHMLEKTYREKVVVENVNY